MATDMVLRPHAEEKNSSGERRLLQFNPILNGGVNGVVNSTHIGS